MRFELPVIPVYNINPDLTPAKKAYTTLEGAFNREGTVYAWNAFTGAYGAVGASEYGTGVHYTWV